MKLRLFLAALAAVLLLSALPANATAPEEPDSLTCIQNILKYYEHYGEEAATDLEYWMAQLTQTDPELGAIWEKILARWDQLDEGQEIVTGSVPDGLRGDDSVCFIVFGYALNADSTISYELLGRAQIALQAHKKYPNALIICSGGNTGSTNKVYSEGWRAYEYLANQGADQDRIVVENKARNTTENVLNSFAILAEEHPEVKRIVFITSDYMIPRAEVLLYAQSLYAAAATGSEPLEILGYGASDPYNPGNETRFQVAAGLALIAGMVYEDYEDLEQPALSTLTGLTVEGPTVCTVSDAPELTVTAHYDSGITRDVTDQAILSGLDLQKEGQQTLRAEYTEGDTAAFTTLTITMEPIPTEPPTEPPTEAATIPTETEAVPQEPAEQDTPGIAAWPLIAAAGAAGLGLIFWMLKKKKSP